MLDGDKLAIVLRMIYNEEYAIDDKATNVMWENIKRDQFKWILCKEKYVANKKRK